VKKDVDDDTVTVHRDNRCVAITEVDGVPHLSNNFNASAHKRNHQDHPVFKLAFKPASNPSRIFEPV
jgi:hypothetical protein